MVKGNLVKQIRKSNHHLILTIIPKVSSVVLSMHFFKVRCWFLRFCNVVLKKIDDFNCKRIVKVIFHLYNIVLVGIGVLNLVGLVVCNFYKYKLLI